MSTLYVIVLAMMLRLSPSSDPIVRHGALASAIAIVVVEDGAIFADDASGERSAALLVAVAFRESSLTPRITGDGGHSVCAMQIYDGAKALNDDPIACVRAGYRLLRASARVDPLNPVAAYARGPRYRSEEARRISRDRMILARSLVTR